MLHKLRKVVHVDILFPVGHMLEHIEPLIQCDLDLLLQRAHLLIHQNMMVRPHDLQHLLHLPNLQHLRKVTLQYINLLTHIVHISTHSLNLPKYKIISISQ